MASASPDSRGLSQQSCSDTPDLMLSFVKLYFCGLSCSLAVEIHTGQSNLEDTKAQAETFPEICKCGNVSNVTFFEEGTGRCQTLSEWTTLLAQSANIPGRNFVSTYLELFSPAEPSYTQIHYLIIFFL